MAMNLSTAVSTQKCVLRGSNQQIRSNRSSRVQRTAVFATASKERAAYDDCSKVFLQKAAGVLAAVPLLLLPAATADAYQTRESGGFQKNGPPNSAQQFPGEAAIRSNLNPFETKTDTPNAPEPKSFTDAFQNAPKALNNIGRAASGAFEGSTSSPSSTEEVQQAGSNRDPKGNLKGPALSEISVFPYDASKAAEKGNTSSQASDALNPVKPAQELQKLFSGQEGTKAETGKLPRSPQPSNFGTANTSPQPEPTFGKPQRIGDVSELPVQPKIAIDENIRQATESVNKNISSINPAQKLGDYFAGADKTGVFADGKSSDDAPINKTFPGVTSQEVPEGGDYRGPDGEPMPKGPSKPVDF